jgi:hypothetical protein
MGGGWNWLRIVSSDNFEYSGSNILGDTLFYYMVTVISDRDTDLVEECFYSQINKRTKGKVF